MEKEFEIIEHTADVGIRAYGANMGEAFANAAKAMFSLITDLDRVEATLQKDVEIQAPDREMLLVEWLSELVFLFDVEHLLFKRFMILSASDTGMKVRCYGEPVDKSRHEMKLGIKAVTYHMLEVESNPSRADYRVQVLFDI